MTQPDPLPPKRRKLITETLKPPRLPSNKKKHITRREKESSGRNWVKSCHDPSTFQDKVMVVSYNILGVENALKHGDLYSGVPEQMLEWNRRKKRICKEINRYKANILCLQEVDRFDDLCEAFRKYGFEGVYKERSGEACDGCALFWKKERFTLLHTETIAYQNYNLGNNVAQLCVFELIDNKIDAEEYSPSVMRSRNVRRFVIANIHVLFNPKRGDIKLGQARMLLEKASKMSREWGSVPVIICGDLNCVPQSPLYQFFSSSMVNTRLHDRKNISGQLEFELHHRRSQFHKKNDNSSWSSFSRPLSYSWSEEHLRLATGSGFSTDLQHPLRLCSAYSAVPGSRMTRDKCGEPLATSFHSGFMGTVDYIWCSKELVPLRVLETLSLNALEKIGGLPSEKWGSDHLAIVCELAFADEKTATSS